MFDDEDELEDLEPHVHLEDDGMMDFEWMEELGKIHQDAQEEREREEKAEIARQRALKAAATRKKNQWAKEDAERAARRGRTFGTIDDQWEKE